MSKTRNKRFKTYGTLLLLFFFSNIIAQDVLMSGTSFDPIEIYEDKQYFAISGIKQEGLMPGSFSPSMQFAENVNAGTFMSGFYYGISHNPKNMDASYKNLIDYTGNEDYMFIFNTSGANNQKYFTYTAHGLKPGTHFRTEIEYCYVVNESNACYAGAANFKIGLNPLNTVSDGLGTTGYTEEILPNSCQLATISTEDAPNNNSINIVGEDGIAKIVMSRHFDTDCSVFGIKSIKIFGTPNIKIAAAQGAEVCNGEIIILQTNATMQADYLWEVFNETSNQWTSIGTRKDQPFTVTELRDYQFRLTVSKNNEHFVSDVITVSSISCCENNGVSMSRQTVFYDNFGRADLSDKTGQTYWTWDYSDIRSPKEIKKTTPYPFRWEISPAPLGSEFAPSGAPDDGQYAVASYLTKDQADKEYEGSMVGWASHVTGPLESNVPYNYIGRDHSGEKEGGVLLINCGPSLKGEVIYDRDIKGLCGQRAIFFECWISVFSSNNSTGTDYAGVDVSVILTDVSTGESTTLPNFTATRSADGGGTWKRVFGNMHIEGTDLNIKIINNSNESKAGNDLAIDDIKIMACSAPTIDLFYSLDTFATRIQYCDQIINLFPNYSDKLSEFYNGKPFLLYQWTKTPNNTGSWKNINSTPRENIALKNINPLKNEIFDDIEEGDSIFFRVIAGSESIFGEKNNFEPPTTANANDPCKNYSVSEPVVAIKKCPKCIMPKFSGLLLSNTKDTVLCPQGITEIKPIVGTSKQDSIAYAYYWSTTDIIPTSESTPILIDSITFKPLQITYDKPGIYTLKMWDKYHPAEESCHLSHQVEIQQAQTPKYEFLNGTTICQGETLESVKLKFTGIAPFTFSLYTEKVSFSGEVISDFQSLTSETDTYIVPNDFNNKEYRYSLDTLKDKHCSLTSFQEETKISIQERPLVSITVPDSICQYANAITFEVSPQPTEGTGVFTTDAPADAIDKNLGIFYPEHAGSGTFTISYTYTDTDKEIHCSNTAQANILVRPSPKADFDLPEKVCSQNGEIPLQGKNSNATNIKWEKWEISDNKFDLSSGFFNPEDGEDKKKYTITYMLESNDGCSDTISKNIEVINVPEPFVIDQSAYIDNVENMKPMVAYGEKNATFTWYNNSIIEQKKDIKADTSKFLAKEKTVGTFSYFVTQTRDNCTSKAKQVRTTISECSSPAPEAKSIIICKGDNVSPTLRAKGIGVGNLVWLDSKNSVIKENSETYTPQIPTDKAGTYTYKVYEVNDKLQCNSSHTTVTITVRELPNVSLGLNQQNFCSDMDIIKFNPYPFGEGSKIEGIGVSITDDHAEFHPGTANGSEDFWIKYTYTETENNTSCTNADSLNVRVSHVDTLIPAHEKMFATWGFVPEIKATNATGTIQWKDSLGRTIPYTEGKESWSPDLPKKDGTYIPGIYKFWATQIIEGCESKPVISTITVDVCPSKKPKGFDNQFCQYTEEMPFVSAEATFPGENSNLAWFANIDSVLVGKELSYGTALNKNNLPPGNHSFFAAEYHEQKQCYGEATQVILTIHEPPAIKKDIPKEVCYYEGLLSLKYIPDGGELSGIGTIKPNYFNTSIAEKETKEYEIYYKIGDEKSCINIDTSVITIRYVEPPKLNPAFLLQDSLMPKPTPPITASGDDAGCIYWYTENQTFINGTKCRSSYTPTNNTPGVQIFMARQKVGECYSDYAETTLEITYCQVTPPKTTNATACADQPTPPVSAEITIEDNGIYTPNGNEVIYWYDQPNASLTRYIAKTSDYTFNGNKPKETTTHTFFARAYSPELECFSSLREATLTLIKPKAPALMPPMDICEGEPKQILKGEKESVQWYTSTNFEGIPFGKGNTATPNTEDSTYTYYAIETDPDYGCKSEPTEITHTIFPKPKKPTLKENMGCQGTKNFYVTGKSEEKIWWYDINEIQQRSTQGDTALLLFEQYLHVGENTFIAKAVSDHSCKSDTSMVVFNLKETPKKPFLKNLPHAICLGENSIIPIIERGNTEQQEIISHWYINKDTLTITHTGQTLNIENETFAVGEFFVSVKDELAGCISQRTDTSIPVRNTPNPTIEMDTIVCQHDRSLKSIEPKYKNQDSVTFYISNIENGLNYLAPSGLTTYPSFNYKANNAGVDFISMTATNGYCSDSITQAFYVIPPPVAYFDITTNNGTGTATFINYSEQEKTFNIETNKLTYKMNFGKEDSLYLSDTFSFESPIYEFYNYGTYTPTLYVTNEYGCTDQITKEFLMDITTALYVPNAFAPESNGIGVTAFLPKGHNLNTYKLSIYDTWGNTVFETTALDPEKGVPLEAWEGKDQNGMTLKSDYYIWKIEATFKNNKEWKGIPNKNGRFKKTGSVFLIR